MVTADFMSRIIGMVVFALIGARLGVDAAGPLGLPEEATWFLFSLVGFLFGLIITPYLTVRPVRIISQSIKEMSIEVLSMALIGTLLGLFIALLMAYPLSLLGQPFNSIAPPAISILGAYLGATIFSVRAREIWELLSDRMGLKRSRLLAMQSTRQLLLDTSVLIDGRIVEISNTGFLGGTMLIPRFVLSELHQVADSSDTLRRNRGRRGLTKLNELQRSSVTPVKIIEEDVEEVNEVDDKLVMLAQRLDACLVTNDYNLNKVAHAQGVMVLNVNALANAVKPDLIPGETFPIHIIQEGRDADQGVGYLEDGTMVVVEKGKSFMDRTIRVTVTKSITRDAGRMIFAVPEIDTRRS
ncbi:MAG: TRAM domain-containing protein [Chitinophagaceae bacterium]|nr:TRAM domain-containing protein [Anaerolineae bacterium]